MSPERHEFYKEMSSGLLERRVKLNLTVQSIAALSGLTIGEYKRVESGRAEITAFEFFKIMEAFESIEKADGGKSS